MEELLHHMKDLHDGKMKLMVVLIHKPTCPHCQRYYPEFNRLCEEIPGLCNDKGKGIAIEYDELDDDHILSETTRSVPRVMFITSNGDHTVRSQDLDETERSSNNVRSMIEEFVRSIGEDDTPMTIVPKKAPAKKKTSKKTSKKKKEQEGKGFVESALAAAVLGGAANIANQSPMVKKYLKQAETGLIGLSKASGNIVDGSMKVLSEQDLMKQLAKVVQSKEKSKSRSKKSRTRTRKTKKRSGKRTRKR
jgi:thiol-disulfide isomerase/thioredoxin